ncbi:MAG: endonuclease [Candidatus Cryptobacteroides sp.]
MNVRHIFLVLPSILVMFWNMENFFDYRDSGSGVSDTEFSPAGQRHWTKRRFYAKCEAFAKTVLWTSEVYGDLPDVVGFAEVENAFVMRSILNSTILDKTPYRYVHHDSPDPRGIDVALIYRSDLYMLESSHPFHIYDTSGTYMKTRDILLVTLRRKSDGSIYHYLVNHHPSKYGGVKNSLPGRLAAASRLRDICDSLRRCDPSAAVVAMGDFNDGPHSPLTGIMEEAGMVNMASDRKFSDLGTIRFEGRWELIDMFFVPCEMAASSSMEILRPPFLMTQDLKHGGEKPLRTYVGPRYAGGVSDHCPVVLKFRGI